MASKKVWFITGCCSGFGREIALAALAHGHKVIATGLDLSSMEDLNTNGATTLMLDVTWDEQMIQQTVDKAVQVHGKTDILVNNAGFFLLGAIEELSTAEIQRQFDVNVFGLLKVTRAMSPYMRKQHSGVIANMGSMTSWYASPAAGAYAASKFAVAGFSLALREEMAPFGVEVIVIEPGHFRTNVLGKNLVKPQGQREELNEVTQPTAQRIADINGKQPGDPAKAAQLLVELLTKTGRCSGRELPSRLLLGSDALKNVRKALDDNRKRVDEWADLSVVTDNTP